MSVLVLTNTGMKIANLMQHHRFSKLSMKDLLSMDKDKDGRITENEFTVAVLMSMGHVREATMSLIHAQFMFLDKDKKGYLDKTVVEALAELQITSLNDLIEFSNDPDKLMPSHSGPTLAESNGKN